MAINISIYSNGNSTSKTVTVDFMSDVLASSNDASFTSTQRHFFKFNTSAKDDTSVAYQVRIVEAPSALALNGVRWASWDAANAAGVAVTNPYPDIKTMVFDYVYDWVNGRTANQNGSGCTARPQMKFS